MFCLTGFVGIVYFPKDAAATAEGKKMFEDSIAKFGQRLLGIIVHNLSNVF